MIKRISTAIALMAVSTALHAATPRQLFEKIGQPVMEKNPSINEFEVCIESVCETFYSYDIPRKNPGAAVDPSQTGGVADAVSDIVGAAAKSVGVGGKIVVDYEKKPDGYVKVRVEASFGTGSGAAAGAGATTTGSNPDDGYSK